MEQTRRDNSTGAYMRKSIYTHKLYPTLSVMLLMLILAACTTATPEPTATFMPSPTAIPQKITQEIITCTSTSALLPIGVLYTEEIDGKIYGINKDDIAINFLDEQEHWKKFDRQLDLLGGSILFEAGWISEKFYEEIQKFNFDQDDIKRLISNDGEPIHFGFLLEMTEDIGKSSQESFERHFYLSGVPIGIDLYNNLNIIAVAVPEKLKIKVYFLRFDNDVSSFIIKEFSNVENKIIEEYQSSLLNFEGWFIENWSFKNQFVFGIQTDKHLPVGNGRELWKNHENYNSDDSILEYLKISRIIILEDIYP